MAGSRSDLIYRYSCTCDKCTRSTAAVEAATAGALGVDGVREEVMDIGHIQPQHLGGQVTSKSYLSILSILSNLSIVSILSYLACLCILSIYLILSMRQGQKMLYLCVVTTTRVAETIC